MELRTEMLYHDFSDIRNSEDREFVKKYFEKYFSEEGHASGWSNANNLRYNQIRGLGYEQSKKYKEIYNRGCCGFKDEIIKCPTTHNLYWVGFNFGC